MWFCQSGEILTYCWYWFWNLFFWRILWSELRWKLNRPKMPDQCTLPEQCKWPVLLLVPASLGNFLQWKNSWKQKMVSQLALFRFHLKQTKMFVSSQKEYTLSQSVFSMDKPQQLHHFLTRQIVWMSCDTKSERLLIF